MDMGTERPFRWRLGSAQEAPIPLASEVQRPLVRHHDFWQVIVAARLEQQHAHVRVFGQATGYDRAGRTRSAHDEVVTTGPAARRARSGDDPESW